jgi:hypothetical protein
VCNDRLSIVRILTALFFIETDFHSDGPLPTLP